MEASKAFARKGVRVRVPLRARIGRSAAREWWPALVATGADGPCAAAAAYNRLPMQRFLVERRLRDLHQRLVRAREELAILDEQLAMVSEEAEDARLRSLVSETPLATHEYTEVRRHADAMTRARAALCATVEGLERRRDELLLHVGTGR